MPAWFKNLLADVRTPIEITRGLPLPEVIHELGGQAPYSLLHPTQSAPCTQVIASLKRCVAVGFVITALLGITTPAVTSRPLPLPQSDQKALRDNFALCNSKLKGPYTENFCVCSDGKKIPVRGANGRIDSGCKNPVFCAAFRAPW